MRTDTFLLEDHGTIKIFLLSFPFLSLWLQVEIDQLITTDLSGHLISYIQIELGFALFLVALHVFFLSCSHSTNVVCLLCAMKAEVNKALDQQRKTLKKGIDNSVLLSATIKICQDCGAGATKVKKYILCRRAYTEYDRLKTRKSIDVSVHLSDLPSIVKVSFLSSGTLIYITYSCSVLLWR